MPSSDAIQSRAVETSAVRDFLRVLRRRWPIVVAALVLVPTTALVASLRTEKEYTATAKLLFRDPGFDQRLFGSAILAPSQDPDREAETNVNLVSLDTVSARVSDALNGRLTPSDVRASVQVNPAGQSNVVVVMATDHNPDLAANVANTTAKQYILFRRAADRSKITEAITLVRRQLDALSARERARAQGRAIVARVEQLDVLASLQTGNAELVQRAEPPRSASSPRPVRSTMIGLMLGLVLGVAFAMSVDKLDRRLRHRTDAEAILERPILGTIPESRGLREAGGQVLRLAGPEADSFRALRTTLRYFAVDHTVQSMLITSSAPGDGKSTIARNLAATAAASNIRVVLLEADLRRPTLNRVFVALRARGLTDVLANDAPLGEVIQQLPLSISSQPGSDLTLSVVTSGHIPPNPTDLLESDRMRDVITELENNYDLVIIDSGPLPVVPDAISLAIRVSGVLVVVRERKTTSTAIRRLRTQFDNLNLSPLGIVINGAPVTDNGGYYGYDLSSVTDRGSTNGPPPPMVEPATAGRGRPSLLSRRRKVSHGR